MSVGKTSDALALAQVCSYKNFLVILIQFTEAKPFACWVPLTSKEPHISHLSNQAPKYLEQAEVSDYEGEHLTTRL